MNSGRMRRRDSSSSSSVHLRCQPSVNSAYMDLEFVDEKQQEMVKQLQDEVQTLKYENNELKFVLYVALKHVQVETVIQPSKDEFKLELEAFARDYLENSKLTRSLQLELESATNLLQEAKWVQNHYEVRNREQELKIEELQKQLFELKTNELTAVIQLPAADYRVSRNLKTRSHRIRSNGRQRSLSTSGQHCNNTIGGSGNSQNNKSGIPTTTTTHLPENYKESVATLPPILLEPGIHPQEMNPFWTRRKKVV